MWWPALVAALMAERVTRVAQAAKAARAMEVVEAHVAALEARVVVTAAGAMVKLASCSTWA